MIQTAFFDMWGGGEFSSGFRTIRSKACCVELWEIFADVAPFIKFLKEIQDGVVVMMASFDDPATK